jgi:phytoene synthase
MRLALRDPPQMPAQVPDGLIDSLALPQRLALAYAPGNAKPAVLALFALDARLAQALRQASEPITAQIRIAWWRDQFGLGPDKRERSDELIRALDLFAGEEGALIGLVDGWESLLSDQLDAESFALGRARAFAALARRLQLPDAPAADAGRRFALADLAANLTDAEEKHAVLGLAGERGRIALPKGLRSLAVLDGLARRSLAKGGAQLLDGPGAMLAAIRLGLAGR